MEGADEPPHQPEDIDALVEEFRERFEPDSRDEDPNARMRELFEGLSPAMRVALRVLPNTRERPYRAFAMLTLWEQEHGLDEFTLDVVAEAWRFVGELGPDGPSPASGSASPKPERQGDH
jgi:hypothetical protein